jgi:hypothetical protein
MANIEANPGWLVALKGSSVRWLALEAGELALRKEQLDLSSCQQFHVAMKLLASKVQCLAKNTAL